MNKETGILSNKPLKEITRKELKEYLSKYRNDEEKFSTGLGEFLSRSRPNAIHFPASMPREEQEKRFISLLKKRINEEHEKRGQE